MIKTYDHLTLTPEVGRVVSLADFTNIDNERVRALNEKNIILQSSKNLNSYCAETEKRNVILAERDTTLLQENGRLAAINEALTKRNIEDAEIIKRYKEENEDKRTFVVAEKMAPPEDDTPLDALHEYKKEKEDE
jgi:hypothetical protein